MEVVQRCTHYCEFGSRNVPLEDIYSMWDSRPRRNMRCSTSFYAWYPTLSMLLDHVNSFAYTINGLSAHILSVISLVQQRCA